MKKSIIIGISIVIALLLCSMLIFQENGAEIEFIKKSEIINKKPYVTYTESTWNNYKKFPKFKNDYGELKGANVVSKDILKKLIKSAFSERELKVLSQQRWIIAIKLTSDGEIVAVRYILQDDSEINTDNLVNLSLKIKKEVKWELFFSEKVTEKGYLMQFMPAYVLVKEKSKPANRE